MLISYQLIFVIVKVKILGRKNVLTICHYLTLYQSRRNEDLKFEGFSLQFMAYIHRLLSVILQPNKVLVAEVIVGKCQTLISKEKGRRSPDDGYNSILIVILKIYLLVAYSRETFTRYSHVHWD